MARLVLPQAQLAQLQGVAEGGPVDDIHLYELGTTRDMSRQVS